MDLIQFFVQPMLATGIEIGLLVFGVGLSLLAGLLLKPKATTNPLSRKTQTATLAERGALIPLILGNARIGATVGWVGTTIIRSTSTGLSFGQGAALHYICVGPTARLRKIYEGGKVIWPVTKDTGIANGITPGTHPSGTTITLAGEKSKFRIYWGEPNQPIDTLLATAENATYLKSKGMGVASRFPHVMYIIWHFKILRSNTGQWPQLEYEIECRPNADGNLTGITSWINGTGDLSNGGPNPACALKQLLCSKYPHGLGLHPTNDLHDAKFIEYGALLATEAQPVNLVMQDGVEASAVVSDILQDTGVLLPQAGGKLVPVPVRLFPSGSAPELGNDILLPNLPEKEFLFGDKPADKLVFTYKDRNLQYRDNEVTVDEDSPQNGRPKLRKIDLPTVIHEQVAAKVADRRQQEELANVRAYRLTASRGARLLTPGQVFKNDDIGQVRVTSVERATDSPNVVIECIQDVYSPPALSTSPGYIPPPPNTGVAVRDVAYDYIELPPPFSINGQLFIGPLRQRADETQSGALLDLSADGTNYVNAASVADLMFSGTLDAAFSVGELPILDIGPVITAANSSDNDIFADLSAQSDRWRTGEQIAVINGEIFFFSVLTALGGTSYRIDGLIRGRLGSLPRNHALGDRVYLLLLTGLKSITHNLVTRNAVLRMRALTFAGDDVLDIPAADPVASRTILGRSLTPYPPLNFRSDDGLPNRWNTYLAGQPITFKWSNRVRNAQGNTAGTQPAGALINASPVMDGSLKIEIMFGATPVRTFNLFTGETQLYTNAQILTDFGSQPSGIEVRASQISGSYATIPEVIVVSKRTA